MKVVVTIGAVIVIIAMFFGFGYLGFSNDANRFENEITATYNNNRNVYDNGWKAVKEMAQVPDIYSDKLKELYQGTLKGRYGENGSKALFQFIQEQNPQLPPELFLKVQRKIETFRNEFTAGQTNLISRKNEYANYLRATTEGRFYNMVGGYPRIDMSKFDIVTSDKTETDFATKKSEPLSLRDK